MGIETMIPAWICFVLGVSFLWVVHVVSMRRLKRWATVNEVFHSATYYGDTPGTATVIVRNARNYIMVRTLSLVVLLAATCGITWLFWWFAVTDQYTSQPFIFCTIMSMAVLVVITIVGARIIYRGIEPTMRERGYRPHRQERQSDPTREHLMEP
ncbi:hypothetical protein BGO18_01605 [Candidatus Saccharibacteria bacterium 47-87]|jgi:FlaA1/EpsC-like NDP-sugar epimerase|nr:MAG: hypothetical protein BGO18_01605 [Candidatus Saccharibacteria bacterium 47-87]